MSLGTSPNPLISSTTKGLDVNRRKCIVADEENGQTSKKVCLQAAMLLQVPLRLYLQWEQESRSKGIDEYLKNKKVKSIKSIKSNKKHKKGLSFRVWRGSFLNTF